MSEALLHSLDARGVATITLNRPERRNAFDDRLIAELTAVLAAYGADPAVRAVVLTGAGKTFSSGGDLEWMRRMADYAFEDNVADARGLGGLMHTLDRLPKPTIALVNGAAYAGGVGLVACCDIAIASATASFCISEVRIGLIPAVISPYVVAAIGSRQARRYFITAEVFDAERAREIGLVHAVVAPEELNDAVEAVVAAILLGAPEAEAEAKAMIFAVDRPLTPEVSAHTYQRIAERRASAEGRDGMSAFLEKREPAWRRP